MHYKTIGALLLPLFAFSYNLDKLSNEKYWKILLHFKKNKSEIDSPNFFLSKNGKFSPKDELNATIYYLTHPKYKDDNSTYCRFPARREWIKSKIPNLPIKKQNCYELNKELNTIKNIKSVSVIFPTILMNSPASMFGHTLLRLNYANGDYLNSFAINYAAQTDETNGLIYAFKGLTGGYIGKYAVLPYYKKIAEYNDIKNRDIWEYTLNLNQEEIHRLKLHLYEVKETWSYYYYFNKNCSYEILWLIQSARPDIELVYKFNYKVLPVDTLKEMKNENLIISSNFRPSKQKIILNYYNHIKHKKIALQFEKNHNEELIKNLPLKEKQYILDFAIEMTNYKYLSKELPRRKYLKEYISLLKKRSRLGKETPPKITPPQNPLTSHESNKLWIFGKKDDFIIGFKPAFHYIDDLNIGFTPGAYIDFFSFETTTKKLQNFYLFRIKSLSPRNDVFKPISWSVKLGGERFKDNKFYATLKTGAYLTYQKKRLLYSIGVNIPQYYRTKYYITAAPAFYMEYNFKNSKIYANFERDFFSFKTYNTIKTEFIQKIQKNLNLNIGYKHDLNQNFFYAGFSLYFF
jgi:hypothetical protein